MRPADEVVRCLAMEGITITAKGVATTIGLLALAALFVAFLVVTLVGGRINPLGGGKPIVRSETPGYFWACYAVFVVAFSAGVFMMLRQIARIWGFGG